MTSYERNNMTVTPNAMPRKANLIHQQILGGLLANKPKSLANNVSDASIDQAAKRWIR